MTADPDRVQELQALQLRNAREIEEEADREDQGFNCFHELPKDSVPVLEDPLHLMHEDLKTLSQEIEAEARILKEKM